MHRLLRIVFAVGVVMTGVGALAPVIPQADILNQFRPYTLVGAAVLFLLAFVLRAPEIARRSATLTFINAALVLLPLLWSARTIDRPWFGHAQASTADRTLKIVTFNLAWRNTEAESIATFLAREDADIVLLQEVTEQHLAALRPALADKYPHQDVCLVPHACRQAVFSKRRWESVEHRHRSDETPEMTSVLFDDPELGGRLLVHNVHLATPYRSRQAAQLERLMDLHGATIEPAIYAGDFNMTPWSYRLQHLLAETGLRRHATFLRSWPTQGQYHLPRPAFLIDHVLTTPEFKTVSIDTGPDLGSDHLPVVATLRLPRS